MFKKILRYLAGLIGKDQGVEIHSNTTSENIKPSPSQLYTLDHPYDLTPLDDILWHNVSKELENMQANQPLVILMGESHAHPTTILPQIGLINNLALCRDNEKAEKEVNFVVTMEVPYETHAILFSALRQVYGEDINSRDKYLNGYYALIGSQNFRYIDQSPLSHLAVEQSCIANNVPVRYVDTAVHTVEGKPALNIEDEMAANVARASYDRDLQEIPVSPFSEEGVHIRNEVMARRALDFAKDMNAKIIVQSCGFSHLYGPNSLTEIFEREGARVLSFLPVPADFLEGNLQNDISRANSVRVEGLSLEESFYSPGTNLAERGLLKKLFSESSDPENGSACAIDFISEDIFMRIFKHNLYQIPA